FAVQYATGSWQVVGIIPHSAAAHNAWSANIFAFASDVFPKNALSSVIGIRGMAGSVGGIFFPMLVCSFLDQYKMARNLMGGYNILFVICSLSYLFAWVLIMMLSKKTKGINVG